MAIALTQSSISTSMVSVPTSQNFHCGVLVAEASVEASTCCYSFELTVYLLKNYIFLFLLFFLLYSTGDFKQPVSHRYKEQTFGLCGRRQGWDDLRE